MQAASGTAFRHVGGRAFGRRHAQRHLPRPNGRLCGPMRADGSQYAVQRRLRALRLKLSVARARP
jgi:hypothetical protein